MCLRVLYFLRSPICLLCSFVNFLYINTTRDISNECFLSLAKEFAWEFRITEMIKCTLQPAEKTLATAHLLTMKPCIYRPCHLLCIVAARFSFSFLLYNSFIFFFFLGFLRFFICIMYPYFVVYLHPLHLWFQFVHCRTHTKNFERVLNRINRTSFG